MIKILHIFSTFAVGGPQRRLAQIAKGLEGYEHVICAMDGNFAAADLLEEGFSLRAADFMKSGFISRYNIQQLKQTLHDEAPDLVCTYNWGSMEAVVMLRLEKLFGRHVAHLHFEDGFGPDEAIDTQIKRRVLARRLLLGNVKVIVPSMALQALAVDGWKLPPGNITYVTNGVDTDHFYPIPRDGDPGITIGAVGALRPEKNFARLIKTFAELGASDTYLQIAGDGPERNALESLITKLGLEKQVHLQGHQEDPAGFYQACDIFALTSDTEQMPLTVLEAMASGLPVVATDVGDIAQMVATENTHYVVPLAQEAALPTVLERLVANSELRQQIGAANRKKVEQEFSQQTMFDTYDLLFQEMCRPAS